MTDCRICGAKVEAERTTAEGKVVDNWPGKYGFCGPAHYVQFMDENRLWSESDPRCKHTPL